MLSQYTRHISQYIVKGVALITLLVGGFVPVVRGMETVPPVTLSPIATPAVPLSVPETVYGPSQSPAAPLDAAELCGETRGQVSVDYFYSPSLRRRMRYRIYLPPCYGEVQRLFPVLYMFHGLNYGDSQWDALGLDEGADAGIAAGTLAPMIIVMPNIWGIDRDPDGGPGSVEQAVVEDLLPYIERRYCAWPQREGRAIGGLSRGAFWALEIAFRHPDMFASAGGHSPAVFWDNAPPQYNPYYLVDQAPGLESLRLYLDVGEEDWLNKWVARFRERLDARGLAYTFATAPGVHDAAYWRTQVAAYLDFYGAIWPTDWRALPVPTDCTRYPGAPGCRGGLGLCRPCDVALP
jgi:enterochelin esterase-like enzyme